MHRVLLFIWAALTFFGEGRALAERWTVLVYMTADNDLEGFAVRNLQEMIQVGSQTNLQIVVQVDRHLKHSQDAIPGVSNFQGVRRFLIKQGAMQQIADLGIPDMTRPETLADFMAAGARDFPADRYALILWDHGVAWRGCCTDENGGRKLMPLSDLVQGIQAGIGAAAIPRLDLLGFDQCLMGNLEVAHAVADLADTLVASPELEPGLGWDYAAWLQAIVQEPTISPGLLGQRIAEAYSRNAEGNAKVDYYTLSVVSLPRLPALATATHDLAGALIKAAPSFERLGLSRALTDDFGRTQRDALGLIDLGQFALNVRSLGPGVQAASDRLQAALKDAVTYRVTGARHKDIGGLSIYLPRRELRPDYATVGFAQQGSWGPFVSQYTEQAQADASRPDVRELSLTPQPGRVAIRASLAGTLEEANVLFANAAGEIMGVLPLAGMTGFTGEVRYEWDLRLLNLTDGTDSVPAGQLPVNSQPINGAVDVGILAEVDTEGNGDWKFCALFFSLDLQSHEGAPESVFCLVDDSGEDGILEVDITARTLIRPWLLRTDGEVATVQRTLHGAELRLHPVLVDPSSYQIGFNVTDVKGREVTRVVPVPSMGCGCSLSRRTAAEASPVWLVVTLVLLLRIKKRNFVRR